MTPEQLELRKQKALDIANTVINTALGLRGIWSEPIPNARLLKKRVFPNRTIPHVKKRRMKAQARSEIGARMAIMCLRAVSGAAQIASIQSRPTNLDKYPSGSR